MIRNTRRIRKEKKIFDPSDLDQPVQKKRKVSREPSIEDSTNGIGNITKHEKGINGDPKIRQCSVKVESLVTLPVTNKEVTSEATCDVKIKEEVLDEFDIDDLLKDDEPTQANTNTVPPKIIIKKENGTSQSTEGGAKYEKKSNIEEEIKSKTLKMQIAQMVIECPSCYEECQGANRLKLHIDAHHEFKNSYIECIICLQRMMGPQYEAHVLAKHSHLLTSESERSRGSDKYVLTPRPIIEASRPAASQPLDEPEDEPEIVFNADNPWQDIFSESVGQKRAIDAKIVKRIKSSLPRLPHKFSQCEFKMGGIHVPRKSRFTADYYRLQDKSEFVSCFSTEGQYQTYLEWKREYKICRRLLDEHRSKLTSSQSASIEALVNCLSNNITTYNDKLFRDKQVKFVPKDIPPNIVKTPLNNVNKVKIPSAPFHPSKLQTGLVDVSPTELKTVMDNLKKKGINSFDMNQSNKSKVIFQGKSLLNQKMIPKKSLIQHLENTGKIINKNNPPQKIIVASPQLKKNIIAMLTSNSTIMVPHKNVSEEKDPLAMDEPEAEQDALNCQSVSENNVIALNIPMEDILGSSSDKADIKSDVKNTQFDTLSIKKEC